MGFLRRIENRLEGVFEGGIGRTFRSHVQPVELARKLTKEMDDNKVISVQQVYVPNVYTVFLAPDDREQFLAYEARLRTELAGYLTEHARREGYSLPGRARVMIETATELEVGTFGIAAEMEETQPPNAAPEAAPVAAPARLPAEFGGGAVPAAVEPVPAAAALVADPFAIPDAVEIAPPAATPTPAAPVAPPPSTPPVTPIVAPAPWVLVWPGGATPIGNAALVIGRSKDCDVPLADGNVSRRHAELGRSDGGFVLRDLDSTNGTLVNGRRVRHATVGVGDEITIGTSTLRIEQRPG